MSASPYMKFYVADYLADTQHLTTIQHGAYLLLIMAYWRRGGPLPDDNQYLGRICKMGPKQWLQNRPAIEPLFELLSGSWSHRRLTAEIAAVGAKSLNNKRMGNANAIGSRSDRVHISDIRSQTSEEEEKKSTQKKSPKWGDDDFLNDPPKTEPAAPVEPAQPDFELTGGVGLPPGPVEVSYPADFEAWWEAYPKKIGKGQAKGAYENAFKRLGGAKAGAERVHAKLLAGAKAYALLTKQADPQFIARPTTWLNGNRWDDAETKSIIDKPKPASTGDADRDAWLAQVPAKFRKLGGSGHD